jgi:hypothetical protein
VKSRLPADVRAFSKQFSVTATYFLLDIEPAGGVEIFVTHTLGRLLQQMSRSNEKRQVELEGEVRGKILWPATYKARYNGSFNPTRFVCGEVYQNYDTPENQLLKYMVEAIFTCLRAVPPAIRQGVCYLPDSDTGHSPLVSTRLGRMESILQQSQRNMRLYSVHAPQSISEFHLLRAETALMEDYATVAQIYRQYRSMVLLPSWGALCAAGRRVLPLPAQTGVEENRWVRLAAAILSSPAGG